MTPTRKKPAPKCKAEPMRSVFTGKITSYRIPVESIPAMVEAMAKGLLKERARWMKYRDVKTIEEQASNHARACLRAIGIEETAK
jgi:hypothetical protein